MLDEMFFIVRQLRPVLAVRFQVNLVNGPEAGHLVLVHLPHVRVLNRQNNEAIRVFFEEWLGKLLIF